VKILLLVVIVVVVCVVLFVAGVFFPSRSRRMQREVDHVSEVGEEAAERKPGFFRHLTSSALHLMQRAADRSAEKGRELHDEATDWPVTGSDRQEGGDRGPRPPFGLRDR
jgi:hypothetical protein